MADIKKVVNEEKNLTILSVFGVFQFEQMIEAIDQLYASHVTLNSLWDFSHADISSITAGQVESVLGHATKYAHVRAGGKTAFVAPTDISFGMARMYEILSEASGSSVMKYVFKKLEDAMVWLET